MQDHNVKQLGRMGMNAKCSAGSNPRICLKKNRRIENFITSYAFLPSDHNVKQLGRISMYAKCIGGCMQGAR